MKINVKKLFSFVVVLLLFISSLSTISFADVLTTEDKTDESLIPTSLDVENANIVDKTDENASSNDESISSYNMVPEDNSSTFEDHILYAPSPSITTIYLNGQKGNDSLDGTSPDNAVKSFVKAKEIAQSNQNITQIIITGSVSISGDISLSGTNAKIVRATSYNQYLFKIERNNVATLSDIIIDGNSDNNKTIEKSLIYADTGSTLNITTGTILKNNKIKDIQNTRTWGGAVYASVATVNMSDGIIENNASNEGGGIYLRQAKMDFTGGIIQNNTAKSLFDRDVSQYYGSGGGILVNDGSKLTMSDNAKVLNNSAGETGGGISLGSRDWGPTNTLYMTDGTVDGNVAGSAGGGIFVQAKYYSGAPSKAYISAGKITNNVMDGTGYTEKEFGGGGIYVNGANNYYGANGANGELYLTNVIITDNTSNYQGAGYAACPISKTKIFITDGGAIYDNHTDNGGKDLYILCRKVFALHGGTPEYKLSKKMLGAVSYNWKTDDNNLLADDQYEGTLTTNGASLSLHTDSVGNTMTANLAKVTISGNRSVTRGGGIGSNGSVTIGTDDESTQVNVKKIWKDNNNDNNTRPNDIKVNLIANGKDIVDTLVLNGDNNWQGSFTELPVTIDGQKIVYTIQEVLVDGYTVNITGNADDGFTITNTHTPKLIDIPVSKVWNDNNNQDSIRPNSITVKLLADGNDTGKTIVLSEDNNWSASFEGLAEMKSDQQIVYTIQEVLVDGYVSNITGNADDGFTITNTHTPNIPPKTDDNRNILAYFILIISSIITMALVHRKTNI